MTATLAATDTTAIYLFVGQMVFNLIFGSALWWGKNKLSKIDQLEQDVQKRADEAITNRFGQMQAKIEGQISQLSERITTIFNRLQRGEQEFRQLGERDQDQEIKLATQIKELSAYIHEHCATKQDIADMEKRIKQIELDRAHERGRRDQASRSEPK